MREPPQPENLLYKDKSPGAPLKLIGAWPELGGTAAAAAAGEGAAAQPSVAGDAATGAAGAGGAEASAAAGGGAEAGTGGGAEAAAGGDSLSEEEAAGLWEYYDDHGRVQGPFRASKLLSWLRAVRRSAGSSDF